MKAKLYTIKSKLSLIFLGAMVIMVCGGVLFSHYANRLLSATSLFMDTTLPDIEDGNKLWQTTLEIENYIKRLISEKSLEDLKSNYNQLGILLNRLENLTAEISQTKTESDTLLLNRTSQAIRSQVQLVFQMEAQKLSHLEKLKILHDETRLQLLSMQSLTPSRNEKQDWKKLHYEIIHQNTLQLLFILYQLDIASTLEKFRKLQITYDNSRMHLQHAIQLSSRDFQPSTSPDAIQRVLSNMDLLFDLQRKNIQIENNISEFISDLNGSVEEMTHISTRFVNIIFTSFQQQAEGVISKGKRIFFLALFLMSGLLLMFFILYWRVVIIGFGDRISRISKAMVMEPANSSIENLPLQGRDEIADMARAAEILLGNAIKLMELARMDELTKVYNRRHFFEVAEQEAGRAARKKTEIAIAMIDIDHFKTLNDTYGHTFGDKVLREMAQSCTQSIRLLDLFARYGGEEFVLLMPETTLEEGQVVAERMRKNIASMHFITGDGVDVQITISIGLAAYQPGISSIEQTVKQADNALYLAKENGRNRVELSAE